MYFDDMSKDTDFGMIGSMGERFGSEYGHEVKVMWFKFMHGYRFLLRTYGTLYFFQFPVLPTLCPYRAYKFLSGSKETMT